MIACVFAIEQESGLAREKNTPVLGKRAVLALRARFW